MDAKPCWISIFCAVSSRWSMPAGSPGPASVSTGPSRPSASRSSGWKTWSAVRCCKRNGKAGDAHRGRRTAPLLRAAHSRARAGSARRGGAAGRRRRRAARHSGGFRGLPAGRTAFRLRARAADAAARRALRAERDVASARSSSANSTSRCSSATPDDGDAIAAWPERLQWVTSRETSGRSEARSGAARRRRARLPLSQPADPRARSGRTHLAYRLHQSESAGIQAAVSAGLGVSILSDVAILPEHQIVDDATGFPPIMNTELALVVGRQCQPGDPAPGRCAGGFLLARSIGDEAGARSIRQTTLGRKSIKPIIAEQVRRELQRAEQIGEGRVAHIEPASECAEGRHHHSRRVGGKTAAADRAATMRNARDRMQMAADFAGRAARQVTEGQRTDRKFAAEGSADALGRVRIMIAGDPDPFAAALQPTQSVTVAIAQPRRPAAIMEAVAERTRRSVARSPRSNAPAARALQRCRKAEAAVRARQSLNLFPDADRRRPAGPAPTNRARRAGRRAVELRRAQ